jgi:hypothetical protein
MHGCSLGLHEDELYIYIFLMFPLASKAPAGHRSWEKALGSMYCGSDGGGGGESIGLSFITENPYSLQAAALVYIYLFTGSRCVKQHRSVTHLQFGLMKNHASNY